MKRVLETPGATLKDAPPAVIESYSSGYKGNSVALSLMASGALPMLKGKERKAAATFRCGGDDEGGDDDAPIGKANGTATKKTKPTAAAKPPAAVPVKRKRADADYD